jgi:hypothetical protein
MSASIAEQTLAQSCEPDDMRRTLKLWCDVERLRLQVALCDLDLVETYARYKLVHPDELVVMMLEMGLTPPEQREVA